MHPNRRHGHSIVATFFRCWGAEDPAPAEDPACTLSVYLVVVRDILAKAWDEPLAFHDGELFHPHGGMARVGGLVSRAGKITWR